MRPPIDRRPLQPATAAAARSVPSVRARAAPPLAPASSPSPSWPGSLASLSRSGVRNLQPRQAGQAARARASHVLRHPAPHYRQAHAHRWVLTLQMR